MGQLRQLERSQKTAPRLALLALRVGCPLSFFWVRMRLVQPRRTAVTFVLLSHLGLVSCAPEPPPTAPSQSAPPTTPTNSTLNDARADRPPPPPTEEIEASAARVERAVASLAKKLDRFQGDCEATGRALIGGIPEVDAALLRLERAVGDGERSPEVDRLLRFATRHLEWKAGKLLRACGQVPSVRAAVEYIRPESRPDELFVFPAVRLLRVTSSVLVMSESDCERDVGRLTEMTQTRSLLVDESEFMRRILSDDDWEAMIFTMSAGYDHFRTEMDALAKRCNLEAPALKRLDRILAAP